MTGRVTTFHAAFVGDVERQALVSDAYVTVEGGRIVEVSTRRPAGAFVELGEVTLLPGLIDMHVHLSWDASAQPEARVASDPPALTTLKAAQHARLHLARGVTTVRDVGSPAGHAVAVGIATRSGHLAGPRVVASGYAIAIRGGHVAGHLSREVEGVHQIRAAVREEVASGARSIKIMASGGITGDEGEQPGRPEFTVEELAAAVDEAHRFGVPITAHAHSGQAIRNAVDAGMDSIEHGSDLDEDLARLMRDTGVKLSATITAVESLISAGPGLGIPAHVLDKAREAAPRWAASTALAITEGVSLLTGTDGGVPGQRHGRVVAEIHRLNELGLEPPAALRAATIDAATALGLGAKVGLIAPGFSADFIAVPGDPFDDLACLEQVRAVVARGRFHPASHLTEERPQKR